MSLILVVDRSTADVERLRQIFYKIENGTASDSDLEEYLSGMKGAYNATDLNRVEMAVEIVNDYLNNMQGNLDIYREALFVASDPFWLVPFSHPLDLTVKTDWTMFDLPTESDLARYLGNVSALTDQFPIEKKLPASMDRLTVEGANEIERAILTEYESGQKYEAETKRLIDNTAKAYVYSGEIFGGEV